MSILIRPALPEDAEALLDIYAYYIEETAISFEYTVPSVAEFRGRIETVLEKYPYLVAERDGKILGYAYASAFHPRQAYAHCCEVSVYVAREALKGGLGRRLYAALEEELRSMGAENAYACIALPIEADEYLDCNSRDFHAHMGYTEVGHFHLCGKKFGRYYDMIYMEKRL